MYRRQSSERTATPSSTLASVGIAAVFACGCAELIGADELRFERGETGFNCRGNTGPTPVNVDGKFCIDSTEVTNADYRAFLASNPPLATDPVCAWNFDYTPVESWSEESVSFGTYPVRFVDFCDARDYCAWAGKRLCGAVGTGRALRYEALAAPRGELYYACSRNGTRNFPYGNSYDTSACATEMPSEILDFESLDAPEPVKSRSRCEGGYPGIFDLSGNVTEWQNACTTFSGSGGDTDICSQGSHGFDYVLRGSPPGASFACAADASSFRSMASESSGIRCCSDAAP